jgi:hypothetical protein
MLVCPLSTLPLLQLFNKNVIAADDYIGQARIQLAPVSKAAA